jgi:hypothetical protein
VGGIALLDVCLCLCLFDSLFGVAVICYILGVLEKGRVRGCFFGGGERRHGIYFIIWVTSF